MSLMWPSSFCVCLCSKARMANPPADPAPADGSAPSTRICATDGCEMYGTKENLYYCSHCYLKQIGAYGDSPVRTSYCPDHFAPEPPQHEVEEVSDWVHVSSGTTSKSPALTNPQEVSRSPGLPHPHPAPARKTPVTSVTSLPTGWVDPTAYNGVAGYARDAPQPSESRTRLALSTSAPICCRASTRPSSGDQHGIVFVNSRVTSPSAFAQQEAENDPVTSSGSSSAMANIRRQLKKMKPSHLLGKGSDTISEGRELPDGNPQQTQNSSESPSPQPSSSDDPSPQKKRNILGSATAALNPSALIKRHVRSPSPRKKESSDGRREQVPDMPEKPPSPTSDPRVV